MYNLKEGSSLKLSSLIGRSNNLSLWFLLFSNIMMIIFAVAQKWSLSTIMWIYWFQSITIGFFNFIRILQLKEFSTEGFKINNQPALPTKSTKVVTAFFFLFHFGLFHLVYMVFLLSGTIAGADDNISGFSEIKYVLMIVFLFFFNHLFSYIYNRPQDTKKQNIGSLMFYPYARIIPMHLTIIFGPALTIMFGSDFSGALILFLILKTVADVIMHIVEHNFIRKGELQEG